MKSPERKLREDRPTNGIEEAVSNFRFPAAEAKVRKWPAAAGLASALATGIVIARMSVSTAEASPLERVIRAERNAVRCIVRFYDEDGKVWGQGWQEGTKNRFDLRPGEVFGFTHATNGRRFWSIDRTSRVAFVETDNSWALAELDNKIANIRGDRIRSETKPNGTSEIVVERKPSGTSYLQRDTILTDENDRPISISHDYLKAGTWVHSSREERDYDTSISPQTFEFEPPKDFEVYDIDRNRSRILQGLRSGPEKSEAGVKIRLLGVLQHRVGILTVLYSGGSTPLPDATAALTVDGQTHPGRALVGNAPDPRAGQSPGKGIFRWPGQIIEKKRGVRIVATPEPYMTLNGSPIRIIQFRIGKMKSNSPRRIRLTLPVVFEGKTRLVQGVQGRGVTKGTVSFEAQTLPSIDGEEVFRMENAKRAAYAISLRLP